jgi:hypothetical protein
VPTDMLSRRAVNRALRARIAALVARVAQSA